MDGMNAYEYHDRTDALHGSYHVSSVGVWLYSASRNEVHDTGKRFRLYVCAVLCYALWADKITRGTCAYTMPKPPAPYDNAKFWVQAIGYA